MEILRTLYTNLKTITFHKEYEEISKIDVNITKLYDIVIRTQDEDKCLYSSEVYLLMTEYLPIDNYPVMREIIRKVYNFTDSYIDEENKDINNISNMNYEVVNILLKHDDNFKNLYKNAKPEDDYDEKIITLINKCLQNSNNNQIENENIEEKDSDIKEEENITQENIQPEKKSARKSSRKKTENIIEVNTDNLDEDTQVMVDTITNTDI